MRSQQHIRNGRFGHQIRALRLDTRVHIVADVAIWPAVKSAILQGSEIIWRKIVAQFVTLIDRRPDFAGGGLQRQSHWIAQSSCILARVFAVRIADGHRGANRVFAWGHIRLGPYADENVFAILGENHGTGVVPTAGQIKQRLRFPEPLRGLWIVLEADELLHGADVNIVIVKSNAERPGQSGSELLPGLRPTAILRISQDIDVSGAGVGHENVVIGSNDQPTWSLKSGCKNVYFKSGGNGGKESLGRTHLAGRVGR